MKGKPRIDLSLSGESQESSRTYYGSTLTSLLGNPSPDKTSVRSLECTRVTARNSARSRSSGSISSVSRSTFIKPSSARSRVTSSGIVPSTCSLSSPWTSRATSAVSRGTSSRVKVRSNLPSTTCFTIPGVLSGTSGSFTNLSLCHMGLTVWRVESDGEELSFLHVWTGSQSYKSEREIARKQAEEMDKSLDGATFMSIECEGHETASFLGHFNDGIVVVEGRHQQALSKSGKYTKRLYLVTGRRYPSATCTECTVSAAGIESVLILDGYPRTYVWVGEQADFVLRVKAINMAKKMRSWQRKGRGHIIVVDQREQKLSETFLRKLTSDRPGQTCGGDGQSRDSRVEVVSHLELYRINGPRVLYDMPLVAKRPVQQRFLTTQDSFLLDRGPSQAVYVWVGAGADNDLLYGAMDNAQNFTQHHNYPTTTALCRVTEGDEPMTFKTVFADWRDRTVKERQLIRSYNVANIGRALSSRSDRRTVAKLSEVWSDDQFLTGDGTTEVWQVQGNSLVAVSPELHGVFHNWHCYVITYREKVTGQGQTVIYYWLGGKAIDQQRQEATSLAMSLDAALEHRTAVMRVLDGKEPKHFLTALQQSIIVYDVDLHDEGENSTHIFCSNYNNKNKMFCVREIHMQSMRVSQVHPASSSLNSSAAFVVISQTSAFLWYGKHATAYEREYSKNMLAYFCPHRCHQYEIVNERREPATFWAVVEKDGEYPRQFSKQILERRLPNLSLCSQKSGKWTLTDIPDFSQEDLSDSDLLILDTHDQVQLWCGASSANTDSKTLSEVVQAYISSDAAGRNDEDVYIWLVNQFHEPSIFTKYFKAWDNIGYGGQLAYQAARKHLRQENAQIHLDTQIVDMGYLSTLKMPYKELMKSSGLPEEIDLQHKEQHLSDNDFTGLFGISRPQFYTLPEWKQQQVLRSARLRSSVPDCSRPFSLDLDSSRICST